MQRVIIVVIDGVQTLDSTGPAECSRLIAQQTGSDPLGAALAWARANLPKADFETLARRAGMSIRTLHRRCQQQLGTTPAKLIDKSRIEHARTLLATSALPAKALAEQCGFGVTAPRRCWA